MLTNFLKAFVAVNSWVSVVMGSLPIELLVGIYAGRWPAMLNIKEMPYGPVEMA